MPGRQSGNGSQDLAQPARPCMRREDAGQGCGPGSIDWRHDWVVWSWPKYSTWLSFSPTFYAIWTWNINCGFKNKQSRLLVFLIFFSFCCHVIGMCSKQVLSPSKLILHTFWEQLCPLFCPSNSWNCRLHGVKRNAVGRFEALEAHACEMVLSQVPGTLLAECYPFHHRIWTSSRNSASIFGSADAAAYAEIKSETFPSGLDKKSTAPRQNILHS